jgi:hypothetical protein
MTGFRKARIAAGYRTAVAACAAYAQAHRGQGISLSYWRKLETAAPRLLGDWQARRFARFFGCSVNVVMTMATPPTTLSRFVRKSTNLKEEPTALTLYPALWQGPG